MPVAKDMSNGAVALGAAPVGFAGRIHAIRVVAEDDGLSAAELELRLVDLQGTYSLRAGSLDEVETRDIVLGRLESEATPSLLVCVADSTNLRVALRLALELKQVGRPMILALNMFDIARHRGF